MKKDIIYSPIPNNAATIQEANNRNQNIKAVRNKTNRGESVRGVPRILTVLIKGPGFRSDRICVTIIEREAYVKFSTAIKIGLDRAGRGRSSCDQDEIEKKKKKPKVGDPISSPRIPRFDRSIVPLFACARSIGHEYSCDLCRTSVLQRSGAAKW